MRIFWMALVMTALAACSAEQARSPEVGSEVLVQGNVCTDPRPEICTAHFDPACGQTSSGKQTYSNGCKACSDAEVISWAPGACE